MTPRDNSDEELLVYADWLLDNNQEEQAGHVRESLSGPLAEDSDHGLGYETSLTLSPAVNATGFWRRVGFCRYPGMYYPVGETWQIGGSLVNLVGTMSGH